MEKGFNRLVEILERNIILRSLDVVEKKKKCGIKKYQGVLKSTEAGKNIVNTSEFKSHGWFKHMCHITLVHQ